MKYLIIKEYLNNFWDENGYEDLIKGLLAFELDENNEKILEELYDYYTNYDEVPLLNEMLLDKYNELKGSEEE